MKSLLIILTGLVTSWIYTDLSSESLVTAMIAPLCVVLFLISFAVWVVLFFHQREVNQTTRRGGDSGGFGDFGGGGGEG